MSEAPTPSPHRQDQRVYLSSPHLGTDELKLVQDAFASNWIAPLGPQVDAFERELADFAGVAHAAALSSGTAALHLALRILGVGPGDLVLCPTLTFCASANPIVYQGAQPVFLDADAATWNLDPQHLAEELAGCARQGKLPRALIAVDLYGQSADYDTILEMCARYEVPVVEDAAEALGATYRGRPAGSFGTCGIFSFNGNKIITSSGGGMLVSSDAHMVEQARFLATQARDPAPHYEHSQIGYNYRLSNVLAAIGRGQLRILPQRVAARTRIRDKYKAALSDISGIEFMPTADYGTPNCWLTCITMEPGLAGVSRETVREALECANIESRPIWKPLHLQPVFSECRVRGGAVAEQLFQNGLCLPSGSNLSDGDFDRVVDVIRETCRAGR